MIPFTGPEDGAVGRARLVVLLPKNRNLESLEGAGGAEGAEKDELEGGAAAGVGIESEGPNEGGSRELQLCIGYPYSSMKSSTQSAQKV